MTKLKEASIPAISLSSVQRDLSMSADTRAFSALYQAIKNFKPDIVHLNSSKVGGLGALAARLVGVPRIIFTAHGWPFAEKRNFLWRSFAYLGSWATALLSHYVIVVSRSELAIGSRLRFCRHKMHLIHNGIKLPLTLGSGEQIRRVFPSGVQITGTIGELTHNKNQIVLIEQASRDPEMYLAIVGEGEDRPFLERKIKEYKLEDRVKLFGFIPAEEALKGFDIFALPSLKEGLPYVLLEAKAAGLSITASRIGGIPDILDAPGMSEFELARMVSKTMGLYTSAA